MELSEVEFSTVMVDDVQGDDSLIEAEARKRLFGRAVGKWMENEGNEKEVSGFGNERVLVKRGNEMVCIFEVEI